jgi:hypothetical protein
VAIITPFQEQSGPEQYVPPDQRSPKNPNDIDQVVNAFEDKLRESLRHLPHQRGSERNNQANNFSAENVNEVIRSVAGASIEEIDRVILELQKVRSVLLNEGKRLSDEFARFSTLNHMSMTAMKNIADSLKLPKANAG